LVVSASNFVHVFNANSNAIRFAMIEQKLDDRLVPPLRGQAQRRLAIVSTERSA
jgi:hypothetical protein